jgi:CubicO group peptidase (beta-lactamase class C family)
MWKRGREDTTTAEHISLFKDQPMEFAPGDRWDYNNSAYYLLGAIIENISGLSYGDFLKRNIFDKLGMDSTRPDSAADVVPGRVAGYTKGPAGVQNAGYLSMTRVGGAGGLMSSVDDLAKWDAALYINRILKRSTLKRAWTPYILKNGADTHYGYGWGLGAYQGCACVEHGGGINGFASFAIRIPKRRIFAAVLMNSDGPVVNPMTLGFGLAALVMGKPYREPAAITLPGRVLSKLAGRYEVTGSRHFTLLVTRKANQLFVQFFEGQPPQAISPSSPSEFFLPGSLQRFVFCPPEPARPRMVQLWDRDQLVAAGRLTEPS